VLGNLDAVALRDHDLRLGEAMLARAAEGDRLSAGAHLMRGGDEVRGATLFARAFRDRGIEARSADLPALERAVAIYDRYRLQRSVALRLRAALVRAGYTLDRSLAYRYGDATLSAMHRAAGLHIVDWLLPIVGRRVALFVGLATAYLRWRLSPRSRRLLHPASAVRQLVQVLTSLLGSMSLGIDVAGMRRLVPTARSLLAFPPGHAVRAGYLLCETLFLFMFGREDEHRVIRKETFEQLDNPKAFPELEGMDRVMMLEGVLLAAGICEAFYADSIGLQLAKRLEGVGSHIGKLGAHRVELVRHLMRGERQAAEPRRRAMELLSLEVGASTWQLELWLAAMESLVALLTDDNLQAKQLLEVYRGFVAQAPSLRVYEEMLRARVERRLGDLAAAQARIEAVCAQLRPREHVGWDAARYTYADILLAAGDPEAALRVVRDTLDRYTQNDDLHVVRLMLCRLEALAQARLGNIEEARASIDMLIDRVTPTGHPLLLARLHETGFALALHAEARVEALAHLEAMEAAIEPTGNPALLVLLHSAAQSAREQGIGAKSPGSAPPEARESSEAVTAVSSVPFRRRRSTVPPA